ncbi:YkoF-like protein [Fusarium solani]|uniref:YkoF-like protein n=1 Tax=Fusarium solani TaxID=169388 RepID=A0A9P9K0P2_FUSSL|nr:YkoF-like protein [Fusarium solani]KAH7243838.1 YkoF-like protein [Fusarium solani]
MDYSLLSTPPSCCADFALVPVWVLPTFGRPAPIGTGNPSIAAELAEVQRYLKSSGLKHTMHSTGTTLEGSWDEVMTAIGKAHAVVHQRNVAKVQSTVTVSTRGSRDMDRTDKRETMEGKVDPVERAA